MKDFILISKGPKGIFTIENDSLQDCLKAAPDQLKAGQECAVFVKHSELRFDSITIVKSPYQLEKEALEITQPIKLPGDPIPTP